MKTQLFILALALFQASLGDESSTVSGITGGRGWIDWLAQRVKNAVKTTGEIYSSGATLAGDTVKKTTGIIQLSSDMGSRLGKDLVGGSMKLGQEGVNMGADLTQQAIGIGSRAVELIPGFGKLVKPVFGLAGQGVGVVQDKTKAVMGVIDQTAQQGFDFANSIVGKGNNFVNNVAQTGVDMFKNKVDLVTGTLVGDPSQ